MVSMKSQEMQFFTRHIMDYITEEDYEDAKKLIEKPDCLISIKS